MVLLVLALVFHPLAMICMCNTKIKGFGKNGYRSDVQKIARKVFKNRARELRFFNRNRKFRIEITQRFHETEMLSRVKVLQEAYGTGLCKAVQCSYLKYFLGVFTMNMFRLVFITLSNALIIFCHQLYTGEGVYGMKYINILHTEYNVRTYDKFIACQLSGISEQCSSALKSFDVSAIMPMCKEHIAGWVDFALSFF